MQLFLLCIKHIQLENIYLHQQIYTEIVQVENEYCHKCNSQHEMYLHVF